ncbi:Uncharacterised protein [Bordetella pertussis]|nr:Uncharacterised protein [Bordetella pertussis]
MQGVRRLGKAAGLHYTGECPHCIETIHRCSRLSDCLDSTNNVGCDRLFIGPAALIKVDRTAQTGTFQSPMMERLQCPHATWFSRPAARPCTTATAIRRPSGPTAFCSFPARSAARKTARRNRGCRNRSARHSTTSMPSWPPPGAASKTSSTSPCSWSTPNPGSSRSGKWCPSTGARRRIPP